MLSKLIVTDAKPLKTCGVCGDRAKSYHFGGISCDSCKAFFRRSVQNDANKAFQCAFRGKCDINMSNRKCCQHCRFRKCLQIGMETSWVMTEEERLQMLRVRMEKKQRSRNCRRRDETPVVETARPDSTPSPKSTSNESAAANDEAHSPPPRKKPRLADNFRNNRLSAVDADEIDKIVQPFEFWFRAAAEDERTRRCPKWMLLVVFIVSIHKLVRFARSIDRFSDLSIKHQISLLRANIFEMFLLIHFSELNSCLFGETWEAASAIGVESRSDGEDDDDDSAQCPFLIGGSRWTDDSFSGVFGKVVQQDVPTLVLLLMIVLFCPDSAAADFPHQSRLSECHQMYYCDLLSKYLDAKAGAAASKLSPNGQVAPAADAAAKNALPKLLLLLPTLREISEKHLSYNFDFKGEDMQIARQLMMSSIEKDLVDSVFESDDSCKS